MTEKLKIFAALAGTLLIIFSIAYLISKNEFKPDYTTHFVIVQAPAQMPDVP